MTSRPAWRGCWAMRSFAIGCARPAAIAPHSSPGRRALGPPPMRSGPPWRSPTGRLGPPMSPQTHILVTGGAGFIGSHLVDALISRQVWRVTVLDKLTYAGSIENL